MLTSSLGVGLAWLVPVLIEMPDELVWQARIATILVSAGLAARFPLGLFYNLLVGQQRLDVQNLRELRLHGRSTRSSWRC